MASPSPHARRNLSRISTHIASAGNSWISPATAIGATERRGRAIFQGLPTSCSYCGQRAFLARWRHRDPRKFAAEIAWLYRTHGVEIFDLADENPTASKSVWKEFLDALIAENVPVTLIGSTRADAIVRDADILHLYKKAGITRWLLGIENYDQATLEKIRKGSSPSTDRQAIQLLRQHNIISMGTWVVGLAEETPRDYLHGLRQLLSYDADQVQIIYATPHRWTPFFEAESQRRVIQTDQRLWDYKHQVLETGHMAAWHVLLWVKLIESIMQLRPRALWRVLFHPDSSFRAGMRWYYLIGRRVWFYEIFHFFLRDKRTRHGPRLAEFWPPLENQNKSNDSYARYQPDNKLAPPSRSFLNSK